MTMEEKEQMIGRMVIAVCASQICAQDIYEDLKAQLVEAERDRDFYKKAYDKVANEFNALAAKMKKEG